MARMGEAAVARWRRRHADFSAPAGGTEGSRPGGSRPGSGSMTRTWFRPTSRGGGPVVRLVHRCGRRCTGRLDGRGVRGVGGPADGARNGSVGDAGGSGGDRAVQAVGGHRTRLPRGSGGDGHERPHNHGDHPAPGNRLRRRTTSRWSATGVRRARPGRARRERSCATPMKHGRCAWPPRSSSYHHLAMSGVSGTCCRQALVRRTRRVGAAMPRTVAILPPATSNVTAPMTWSPSTKRMAGAPLTDA